MPKVTTSLFGDLAILPYQAEAPIKETFEFLTDIIPAYDSTEERLQLRTKPRQSFNYSIPISLLKNANAFNTEYGALRNNWAIPLWTQSQYLGTLQTGYGYSYGCYYGSGLKAELLCDTTIYEFYENSLALLYNDFGEYQVLEIEAITKTSITITLESNLFKYAWLVPLRVGWIKSDINKVITGYDSKSTFNFVVDDNPIIEPLTPTQYLGDDIYFDLPLQDSGNIQANLTQQQDIIDSTLGLVERRTTWNNAQYGKPWNFLLESQEDIFNFKQFLLRRFGKFKQFWFPTFENNLRLKNIGIITDTILIKPDSFIDYINRSNIVFQTLNLFLPFGISNPIQIDESTIQLTLSSNLNLYAKEILNVSYLGLYRLNTDMIEINHIGNNVATASLQILELSA